MGQYARGGRRSGWRDGACHGAKLCLSLFFVGSFGQVVVDRRSMRSSGLFVIGNVCVPFTDHRYHGDRLVACTRGRVVIYFCSNYVPVRFLPSISRGEGETSIGVNFCLLSVVSVRASRNEVDGLRAPFVPSIRVVRVCQIDVVRDQIRVIVLYPWQTRRAARRAGGGKLAGRSFEGTR